MRNQILFPIFLFCLSVSGIAQPSGWQLQPGVTSEWLHDVHFVDKNTGWAVGESGTILKSTTGGASWAFQSSGTTNPLEGVEFLDGLTGIAVGGCVACDMGIILKTTDGGSDWTTTYTGGDLFSIHLTSSTVGWAVGDNGLVLKTTDAGDTWTQQETGTISTLASVSFVNDSTGWTAGYFPGTVLKTTDGGSSWVSLTNGISEGDDINSVFFSDHQTGWIAGSAFLDTVTIGIIRKTTDGGATWLDQPTGTDLPLLSIVFTDSGHGWTSGSSGIILKTTNGGSTWAPETSGTDLQLDNIQVRAGEGAWAVGLNGNIVRNNFGTLQIGKAITFNSGWNMVCTPFAVSNNKKTTIFPTAISAAFLYNPSAGYQVSDSIGQGWGYWIKLARSQDIVFAGYPVDSLTLNLTSGWNMIGGIGADIPVAHIIQNPPGSLTSVFGYNTSYFPTTSIETGKAYWFRCIRDCQLTLQSKLGQNIPASSLTNIALLKNDVQPPGGPAGETESEKATVRIPTEYALRQNYPNPFNPSTTIQIELPEQSFVVLSVFNVIGEEVTRLLEGQMDAGYRSVSWSSTDRSGNPVPSGVYLYRISATSIQSNKHFTDAKKFLLLK